MDTWKEDQLEILRKFDELKEGESIYYVEGSTHRTVNNNDYRTAFMPLMNSECIVKNGEYFVGGYKHLTLNITEKGKEYMRKLEMEVADLKILDKLNKLTKVVYTIGFITVPPALYFIRKFIIYTVHELLK